MRQIELNPAYAVATAPSAVVLSAADLNLHLRVDADDEDDLVEAFIAGATELVETDSRLYLRPASLVLHLDRFPVGQPVCVQRCPVTAVTAVKYIDPDGEEQTWNAANYVVDLHSRPARVRPAYGLSWPTIRSQPHAVSLEFDCGFADGEVPEVALQMIRLLVGHWFENREAVGTLSRETAFAYTALLERLQFQG